MATNNTSSKEPQAHHIFINQNYVHTYTQLYKFQDFFFLQKLVNTALILEVKRILICPSFRRACTWKLVLKQENNELNELSECMLYKMLAFSEKCLKTVKLPFSKHFQKPCFALKVSKNFS